MSETLIELLAKCCNKKRLAKFPSEFSKISKNTFIQKTSGGLFLLLASQNQSPEVFYEKRCS